MPFVVAVLHIDFIDSTGYKHSIMKQAEALMVFSGATTGYSVDINYNAVTLLTLTEGVEWADAGSDDGNAELLFKLINNLSMTNQIPIFAEWERGSDTIKVLAKMIGRGGTGVELDVTGGAAIVIDGAATANLRDYTYDGRGPAGEVLQQWLDANVPVIGGGAGQRIAGSLKVEFVPIPEGTQVMVMWEEN